MKNFISVLLAFALIFGLSQCKKNVETVQSVPAGVYITLDVDGGDKVIVNPTPPGNPGYASVTFEAGDVIYVGNNGAYCGYLTYNGTSKRFEGNIDPTSGDDNDYLHFYFMGNKGPVGSAPSSVDISDQAAKYPVISYGRSTYLYSSSLTSYSATLQNYCSIMKFPIAGAGTNDAIIIGMNNVVTVDFSKNKGSGAPINPYTYSKSGKDAAIGLHSESVNEKWAIVLPQGAVDAQLQSSRYKAQTISVPAISTNEYHNNDIDEITLSPITYTYVDLGLPSGLLWATCNIGASSSEEYGCYFAWGDTELKAFYDWSTYQYCMGSNSTLTKYCSNTAHGYNGYTDDLTTLESGDDAVMANCGTGWRMPTYENWRELLNNTNTTNKWTTQNGVYGRLFTSKTNSNTLFLPAASGRFGSSIGDLDPYGYYWSSSLYTDRSSYARFLYFDRSSCAMDDFGNRFAGHSVRAVCEP